MSVDIAARWASHIIKEFVKGDELKETFSGFDVNGMIHSLPPGECHLMIEKGLAIEDLAILGESLTVQRWAQMCFFDVLQEARPPQMMTLPVLVRRKELQDIGKMADWRTLHAYMATIDLIPVILFRNTPVSLGAYDDLYIADLRIRVNPDGAYKALD